MAGMLFLAAVPAQADWSQSFQYTTPGAPNVNELYIDNVSAWPGGQLPISLGNFSDPTWSWYYQPPFSTLHDTFVIAEGQADSALTFSVDFSNTPDVPVTFDFYAWNVYPFVILGAAAVSWDGAGSWTVSQFEWDIPTASLVPTPSLHRTAC
jgi:hypothetical protein